jgi:hypothetical protein
LVLVNSSPLFFVAFWTVFFSKQQLMTAAVQNNKSVKHQAWCFTLPKIGGKAFKTRVLEHQLVVQNNKSVNSSFVKHSCFERSSFVV